MQVRVLRLILVRLAQLILNPNHLYDILRDFFNVSFLLVANLFVVVDHFNEATLPHSPRVRLVDAVLHLLHRSRRVEMIFRDLHLIFLFFFELGFYGETFFFLLELLVLASVCRFDTILPFKLSVHDLQVLPKDSRAHLLFLFAQYAGDEHLFGTSALSKVHCMSRPEKVLIR